MMRSVMLWLLVLGNAVPRCSAHEGGHSLENCCHYVNHEDITNSTEHRMLRERLTATEGVSRWNDELPGQRKLEEKCNCDQSSKGSSVVQQAVTSIVIVFLAAFVVSMGGRSLRRRRQARRNREESMTEMRLLRSQVEARVQSAKAALVQLDSSELEDVEAAEVACPICLEVFTRSNRAVRPPNCTHVFHADCLGQWLDTAVVEANKSSTTINGDDKGDLRALTCPTCCRPLYSVVDVEAPLPPVAREEEAVLVNVDDPPSSATGGDAERSVQDEDTRQIRG